MKNRILNKKSLAAIKMYYSLSVSAHYTAVINDKAATADNVKRQISQIC